MKIKYIKPETQQLKIKIENHLLNDSSGQAGHSTGEGSDPEEDDQLSKQSVHPSFSAWED